MNLEQVSEKLSSLQLKQLSERFGLSKSSRQKITPLAFIVSFFHCLGRASISLQDWADSLMELFQIDVSKQGLDKRLSGFRHLEFCKSLLKATIGQSYQEQLACSSTSCKTTHPSIIPAYFNRALLQDSSCLKLPPGAQSLFPGAHSSKGQAATAKLQLTMDLISDQPVDIELTHFRKNDQADSKRIIEELQPKDLLIRDMGYFVLEAFKLIEKKSAFFISRLRPGVNIYESGSNVPINVLKLCKKKRRNGIKKFELPVEMGTKERVAVRLMVYQVPQTVYQARRRKALKDRNIKASHSDEYLELLQWQFLITNADAEILDMEIAAQIYRLRWRIEIIFKCWKSGGKLNQMFHNKQLMKPTRCAIMIYLFLTYLLLFGYSSFHQMHKIIFERHQRVLSICKWFSYLQKCTTLTFEQLLSEKMVKHIARAHCYEIRRRQSHHELLYTNFNG